jgi:hypothetical protein
VAAEFVALADLLRAPAAVAVEHEPQPAAPFAAERVARPGTIVPKPDAVGSAPPGQIVEVDAEEHVARQTVRAARLFRARLADAFDDAAARLLRELACDVLARELRLAPCELSALVRRARERMPVVRVRVAACDVVRVGMPLSHNRDVEVIADSALVGGDAVVEVAGGAFDARLGVRLATVLEAFA